MSPVGKRVQQKELGSNFTRRGASSSALRRNTGSMAQKRSRAAKGTDEDEFVPVATRGRARTVGHAHIVAGAGVPAGEPSVQHGAEQFLQLQAVAGRGELSRSQLERMAGTASRVLRESSWNVQATVGSIGGRMRGKHLDSARVARHFMASRSSPCWCK